MTARERRCARESQALVLLAAFASSNVLALCGIEGLLVISLAIHRALVQDYALL